MKKHKSLFLFVFILTTCFANAQIRFFFGPAPESTAEETEGQMNKLIEKSYIFTFYYTSDSISDSVLIHDVILMNVDYNSYCLLNKEDTTHVVVSVCKLYNGGFKVTQYWDNRNVKRTALYTKNIVRTGKWFAYYKNRWLKWQGKYEVGLKNGKWKYYDDSGNKTLVEQYKDGVLLKSERK